jgi:hypothetical protein
MRRALLTLVLLIGLAGPAWAACSGSSPTGAGNNPEVALGIEFSSGIGICITTAVGGTGDVAANELVANVFYK